MSGAGEKAIIDRIRQLFPRAVASIGIGDDAAVMTLTGESVFTTDMLVEDVDFPSAFHLRQVARKALHANLSDLAAMGATPSAFLLTLALPEERRTELEPFLEELSRAAAEAGIELIGGDLSRSATTAVSIVAIGRLSTPPLLRSGAQIGERLYLSRPIGGAQAGLALLRSGWRIDERGSVQPPEGRVASYEMRELAEAAVRCQVVPVAETALGPRLAALGTVGACIDLSDGLSRDLRHICEASNVGAVVEWERLPVFPSLPRLGPHLGIDVAASVLHGGEEYALLFTSRERESTLSAALGRPVYAIGRIIAERGVRLSRGGHETLLEDHSFDHFAT